MVKLLNNKGFSLVESLLVLFIMGLVTRLSLNPIRLIQSESQKNAFTYEYNQLRISALVHHEAACLDLTYVISDKPICINKKGNVNQAQTIRLANEEHVIIIYLGSGYYQFK